MKPSWPNILKRKKIPVSPWVQLIEKKVLFAEEQNPETYHNVTLPDYVAILARTPGNLIPIVRQYRPAVETYTWELPAGLQNQGENPEQTCRRELLEETGLEIKSVRCLGTFFNDTGRLDNKLHAYFAEVSEHDPNFVPEEGMSLDFVTDEKLKNLVIEGEFKSISHIAVLLLFDLYQTEDHFK